MGIGNKEKLSSRQQVSSIRQPSHARVSQRRPTSSLLRQPCLSPLLLWHLHFCQQPAQLLQLRPHPPLLSPLLLPCPSLPQPWPFLRLPLLASHLRPLLLPLVHLFQLPPLLLLLPPWSFLLLPLLQLLRILLLP